jgi:hypothetical protein
MKKILSALLIATMAGCANTSELTKRIDEQDRALVKFYNDYERTQKIGDDNVNVANRNSKIIDEQSARIIKLENDLNDVSKVVLQHHKALELLINATPRGQTNEYNF